MSAIGTALGPSLGGMLIASFGWRSMFLANGPFGIAAWILVQRCLPADVAEAKATSPLIRLQMLKDRTLSGSLAMSAIVATVMMSTLVVGPFHLSRALGLGAASGMRITFVVAAILIMIASSIAMRARACECA